MVYPLCPMSQTLGLSKRRTFCVSTEWACLLLNSRIPTSFRYHFCQFNSGANDKHKRHRECLNMMEEYIDTLFNRKIHMVIYTTGNVTLRICNENCALKQIFSTNWVETKLIFQQNLKFFRYYYIFPVKSLEFLDLWKNQEISLKLYDNTLHRIDDQIGHEINHKCMPSSLVQKNNNYFIYYLIIISYLLLFLMIHYNKTALQINSVVNLKMIKNILWFTNILQYFTILNCRSFMAK